MKNKLLALCLLVIPLTLEAAKVDTLDVYSHAMKKYTKTCVVVPDNYGETAQPYPVLYLLHGYSGNYASWIEDFPQVRQFSDQYKMIIVGADGAYSSWYFDNYFKKH